MNKKNVRLSALFVLVTSCVFAQQNESAVSEQKLDEVVVSDSKFPLAKEKSGKVISKITAEDLKNREGQSVAAVLNSVVGLEINGSQSVAGKNLNYYIRGGRSNQVLILIDGVPVVDASGIGFEYDLRLLPAEQVENIEIMKGASSTLYGTGAAAAVINITLKKGGKKAIQGNAYINAGTNNTASTSKTSPESYNQGFSVGGNVKSKVDYLFSLNSTEVKGISQIAAPNENVTYEDDPFSRINYLAKAGYKATEKLTLDFFGSYDRIKNDYDLSYDNTGSNDTPFNKLKTEQYRFGFMPKYKYNKGEFVLNSSFNNSTRSYDDYDSYSATIGFSEYESRNVNVDAYNKYEIDKSLFVIAGAQYQFLDMNSVTPYGDITKETTKFNMIDPYVTGVYTSDFGLNINAGARLNIHSEYGNQLVYNFNPSYDFKAVPLKLLASYSTAFITPSLYQLYSPYGNTALTPERDKTTEAGFEAGFLNKKLKLSVVGFYREQTDFIGFSPAYKYENISGVNKTKGVETELSYAINDNIKWLANYAFTQVDKDLERLIPKHKVNSSLDFTITKRLFLNLNYQFVDSRKDAYFDGNTYTAQNVVLESYQLVNSLLRYELIKDKLSVFGAVNNILNEEYVENIGYSTLGRNFRCGLNLNL